MISLIYLIRNFDKKDIFVRADYILITVNKRKLNDYKVWKNYTEDYIVNKSL